MKGNNMSDNKNVNQDKGLQGNEKIEQAIAALQQEATQEMLAHTLTVIRRRMRENGQFILSVEPPNHIKVIWIGVESDELLVQLHDKLDKEFAAIGFDKDKKFSTHLTIGRMKSAKGKNQVRDIIEEFENVEIGEMNISNIAFKKSTLKPSGPIYENLKTYDL